MGHCVWAVSDQVHKIAGQKKPTNCSDLISLASSLIGLRPVSVAPAAGLAVATKQPASVTSWRRTVCACTTRPDVAMIASMSMSGSNSISQSNPLADAVDGSYAHRVAVAAGSYTDRAIFAVVNAIALPTPASTKRSGCVAWQRPKRRANESALSQASQTRFRESLGECIGGRSDGSSGLIGMPHWPSIVCFRG